MYRKANGFFVVLFIAGIFLLGAINHAHAESMYLPEDQDQILPYLNDSKKNVRFRGSDQFVFTGGEKTKLTTGLVRDQSGTLYYVIGDQLIASSLEGDLLWSYHLSFSDGVKNPVIGADGTIYVCVSEFDYGRNGTSGVVYAFSRDGVLKWMREMEREFPIGASYLFAGDINGNVIFQTEKGIVSMAPGGRINWVNTGLQVLTKYEVIDSYYSNIADIQTDGRDNIIIQLKDSIASLDKSGNVIWKKAETGWVYLEEGTVYILSPEGIQAYNAATGAGRQVNPEEIPLSSPLPHDHEGGFYITVNGGVSKISADGTTIWTYTLKESGYGSNHTTMRSDSQGNLYFSTNGASVYSLDKNGNERYALLIQQRVFDLSDIAIDSAGTLYFLSDTAGFSRISTVKKEIRIRLDEREVLLPVYPTLLNNVTMLPMRNLFELLGASINWEAASQSVTGSKEGKKVSTTVGSTTAIVNGATVVLDEAPIIRDGYTMVPLRFIAETFGYDVAWDPEGMIIELNRSGEEKIVSNKIPTTQTVISDKVQRFYLTAPGDLKPQNLTSGIFFGGDLQAGLFMQMESMMKEDFASDTTVSDVEEILGEALKVLINNMVKSKGVPLTVGDLKAIQFEVTGEVEKLKLKRLITIYETEERFYIMQAWSLESKYQELVSNMKDMAGTFRLMDIGY
ncbi:stalk domain-containing protein [Paenibacillus mesotrionivorans]|uniref:Stalk domain-containing protein n=1 Tax=Paenibacillus mesotrionivorans TaxID=3160968 RepID=A0ACC7P3Y8_9BACL